MNNIKSYEQFCNEELDWKKLATGAAIVGTIGLGAALSGPYDVANLEDTEVIAGKK